MPKSGRSSAAIDNQMHLNILQSNSHLQNSDTDQDMDMNMQEYKDPPYKYY